MTTASASASNPSPLDFCRQNGACSEGRDFAAQFAAMAEVWDACPRVDWLFWIARHTPGALPADDAAAGHPLRRFAVWCATMTPLADGRLVYALVTDPRSRRAIETAERYCYGGASVADLRAAYAAAYAADAYAAAYAADAYTYADADAADAADAAAYAAAYAAGFADADANPARFTNTKRAAREAQAHAFRSFIRNPFLPR